MTNQNDGSGDKNGKMNQPQSSFPVPQPRNLSEKHGFGESKQGFHFYFHRVGSHLEISLDWCYLFYFLKQLAKIHTMTIHLAHLSCRVEMISVVRFNF